MHMLGLEDEVENPEPIARGPRERSDPERDRPVSPGGEKSSITPRTSSGEIVSLDDSSVSTPRPNRPAASEEPADSSSVRTVVRPVAVAANARPRVVRPSSFNEAQLVADGFKVNQPVVMDLQDADRDLARRLIDFASGLCYGLGGQMERLDTQVYLLTPANVSVSEEERRRLRDRGYDS